MGEEQEPGARIQDSGFRTDKTEAHMPEAGAIFGFKFSISDRHAQGRATYCLLPFGILGAAEVMRVFQSEFFDASQKYDELSALASCWL